MRKIFLPSCVFNTNNTFRCPSTQGCKLGYVINLKKNEDEVNLVTLIDHDNNLCMRLILVRDEQKVLCKTFNYKSPRKWR